MKIRLKKVKVYQLHIVKDKQNQDTKKQGKLLKKLNSIVNVFTKSDVEPSKLKSVTILNKKIDKIIDLEDINKERMYWKTRDKDIVHFTYQYKDKL
ncbi:MAG: hypothetical protein JXQ69_03685 [Paludibacteraceae bacterium]|nr:hypothetical protein [Paludibacteraceae bacterium]